MASLKYNWPNVGFAIFTLGLFCFFILIGAIGTAVVSPFYNHHQDNDDGNHNLFYLLIIVFPSLCGIFSILFVITLCLVCCNRRYFVTDNPYSNYP